MLLNEDFYGCLYLFWGDNNTDPTGIFEYRNVGGGIDGIQKLSEGSVYTLAGVELLLGNIEGEERKFVEELGLDLRGEVVEEYSDFRADFFINFFRLRERKEESLAESLT